jgi:hypothetical protein
MLPAISDLAQVFLAVGPALIAGAVGYLGARLQYRGGERAQELQQRTTRKEVYARFVDNVLAEWRAWSQPESLNAAKLSQIWSEGHGRLSEIYLVATERVVDAATKWTALSEEIDGRIVQLMEEYVAQRGESKEVLTHAVRDGYAGYEGRVEVARDELIGAMRQDVGPRARTNRRVRLVRDSYC